MASLFLDPTSAGNLIARYVPGGKLELQDGRCRVTLGDGLTVELNTLVVEGKVLSKPLEVSFRDVAVTAGGININFEIG